MLVAGAVGIPVYFVLLLTIGPSQDSFSNVNSMLEQVASYQLVGALQGQHLLLCTYLWDGKYAECLGVCVWWCCGHVLRRINVL